MQALPCAGTDTRSGERDGNSQNGQKTSGMNQIGILCRNIIIPPKKEKKEYGVQFPCSFPAIPQLEPYKLLPTALSPCKIK
jgi:hypothetical protein